MNYAEGLHFSAFHFESDGVKMKINGELAPDCCNVVLKSDGVKRKGRKREGRGSRGSGDQIDS